MNVVCLYPTVERFIASLIQLHPMTRLYRSLIFLFFVSAAGSGLAATQVARPIKVAILDFGATETGLRSAEKISQVFAANGGLILIERAESGPAARGIGYTGSLNMTLEDARDLGAAVGCEFYLIGDAQTLRRSSSARPVYYESYASIFIVSARTGRLAMWERPSFDAASSGESEKLLSSELTRRASIYLESIQAAERNERNERELSITAHVPLIEEVPDEASPQAKGLRLPQPYRRLRPTYPDTAQRAEAEATVDVLVDLDSEGEVERVEIVRWAGFGLDEETVNTVRRMHFRPAMRDGKPLPMRVLLRYNFVSPKRKSVDEQKAEAGKREPDERSNLDDVCYNARRHSIPKGGYCFSFDINNAIKAAFVVTASPSDLRRWLRPAVWLT